MNAINNLNDSFTNMMATGSADKTIKIWKGALENYADDQGDFNISSNIGDDLN